MSFCRQSQGGQIRGFLPLSGQPAIVVPRAGVRVEHLPTRERRERTSQGRCSQAEMPRHSGRGESALDSDVLIAGEPPPTPTGNYIRRPAGATPEARTANQAVVELLKSIAEKKDGTPAQVALAWLLAQKPCIVPIPGTTKLHCLEENLGAVDLQLSADDLRDIDTAASKIEIQGLRLPEFVLKMSES